MPEAVEAQRPSSRVADPCHPERVDPLESEPPPSDSQPLQMCRLRQTWSMFYIHMAVGHGTGDPFPVDHGFHEQVIDD